MEPSSPVIVLTTLPTSADGEAFARVLVDERLAGCVSVLAEMRSVYRWNAAVEHDVERQVIIKTTAVRLAALASRVAELHPYEVPEWLVIEPSGGSPAYVRWLQGAASSGLS